MSVVVVDQASKDAIPRDVVVIDLMPTKEWMNSPYCRYLGVILATKNLETDWT
jgi:hypothetical protein